MILSLSILAGAATRRGDAVPQERPRVTSEAMRSERSAGKRGGGRGVARAPHRAPKARRDRELADVITRRLG